MFYSITGLLVFAAVVLVALPLICLCVQRSKPKPPIVIAEIQKPQTIKVAPSAPPKYNLPPKTFHNEQELQEIVDDASKFGWGFFDNEAPIPARPKREFLNLTSEIDQSREISAGFGSVKNSTSNMRIMDSENPENYKTKSRKPTA